MRYTKEQLRRLYIEKQLSGTQIAEQLAIPASTIYWALQKFNIPRRRSGPRDGINVSPETQWKPGQHPSPETQFKRGEHLYPNWNKGLTKATDPRLKIHAEKVSQKLKGGSHQDAKYCFSREFYQNLYRKQGLSLSSIARRLDCGVGTIHYYMKKYNISRRNLVEAVRRKPTEPERRLIEIMERHDLPFKYVGNGKVILGGFCPDFINVNGEKQVIEVFGDYWHTGAVKNWNQLEGGRIHHYAKFGFKTLILWENELTNEEKVIKKIKQLTGEKAQGGIV